MNKFYTYAYLREDNTPYYIGKGKGPRYKSTHHVPIPKDKSKILLLKKNLTEEEAFKHEKYMIAVLGRKDLGTGILRNLSVGGERGPVGYNHTEEARVKISKTHKGRKFSDEHKRKIAEGNRKKKFMPKGRKHSEETKRKIGRANSIAIKGKKLSEESKRKQSNTWKEKLKNNPRPMSYYTENLKKMAEINRTDKEKHKRHSEFMKGKCFRIDPFEYKGIVYKNFQEAINKTSDSRYIILKNGGRYLNK